MTALETQLTELGVIFALVLARVAALVATAPLLSDTSFPLKAKVLFAVALAALVTPMAIQSTDTTLPQVETIPQLATMAVSEIIVGLVLGLGLMAVMAGVQLTGQIVGQMSGMALAEGADPVFGGSASVFGQFYYLVTSAVFVAAGGHQMIIEGLLDTFVLAPPGSGFETEEMMHGFLGLIGLGFELGIRASAPLLLALFLATLVLGLVSRTLPQINTMVVGFGINAMLTLGVMMASLGTVAYAFQAPLSTTIDSLVESLRAGSG